MVTKRVSKSLNIYVDICVYIGIIYIEILNISSIYSYIVSCEEWATLGLRCFIFAISSWIVRKSPKSQ